MGTLQSNDARNVASKSNRMEDGVAHNSTAIEPGATQTVKGVTAPCVVMFVRTTVEAEESSCNECVGEHKHRAGHRKHVFATKATTRAGGGAASAATITTAAASNFYRSDPTTRAAASSSGRIQRRQLINVFRSFVRSLPLSSLVSCFRAFNYRTTTPIVRSNLFVVPCLYQKKKKKKKKKSTCVDTTA